MLLAAAVEPLRPEGKPLFAGLQSLGLPGNPMGDMWRLADMLREYRGDAHTAAWTSAGLHATEVGLLTELYWGLPMRSYIRTRGLDGRAADRGGDVAVERGLVADGAFTPAGRALRESVEVGPMHSAPSSSTRSETRLTNCWPSSTRGVRPSGRRRVPAAEARTTWLTSYR